MSNVKEVRMTCEDTSHWSLKRPLGKSIEFEAKTTRMDPERGIGWNTTQGDVMSGEARFEQVPPGRPRIDPPGGGEAVANVLSNPERNLKEDLQNFAKIAERGELGGLESQTSSR